MVPAQLGEGVAGGVPATGARAGRRDRLGSKVQFDDACGIQLDVEQLPAPIV